jgi:hypothetical protein
MDNTFGGFNSDFSDITNEYNNSYVIPQKRSQGEKWADLGLDVLSMAGTGATIGATFGGIGAPIGATIGGIIGGVKGAIEWKSEDKKQFEQSKAAEKYNAQLEQIKDARLRGRALSNDTRTSQIQSQIQFSNINNYLSDIQNPY